MPTEFLEDFSIPSAHASSDGTSGLLPKHWKMSNFLKEKPLTQGRHHRDPPKNQLGDKSSLNNALKKKKLLLEFSYGGDFSMEIGGMWSPRFQMRTQTCLIRFTANIGEKSVFQSFKLSFLSLVKFCSGTGQIYCWFFFFFLTVLVNSLEFFQLVWEYLLRFLKCGNSRHKLAETA